MPRRPSFSSYAFSAWINATSPAALGIADVLEGAGISPDLIVGCSSGALYGAAIAMGMSRSKALTLWSSELTEQRRWRAYAELLAPRLFGFGAHFSLRDAGRISARIRHGFGGWQLEALPKALRIVTTDAATGESVVLTRGSLADALYASVALPFVFPSISLDGRRLADGVLSNPLPISVAAFGSSCRHPRQRLAQLRASTNVRARRAISSSATPGE